MSEPEAVDKAFTESDKRTLGDLKLQPWTPDRIIKAQEMGQVYPNIGKAGRAQFRKTNVYPGAMRDVIIFVYLSSLPADEVDDATYHDAKAFGAERGLHISEGEKFWEAYSRFIDAQNEIAASTTVPKSEGGDGAYDDDDSPKD